ncbi:hypothetical protein TGAMA5MH_02919 [Trichoderma gamsii]|uniref:Uncharacterized protein n=1 Tax=Trichoderma gamsii TaxID=398673 RepID=A0A2K0TJJ0_9HYPO|nr:hypothetical protein TGAMA5MH_02919 [Trichoderma gamsii]
MAPPKSSPIPSGVVPPITPPYESEGPPAKEKRRRAGKPKVRTGCVTCK